MQQSECFSHGAVMKVEFQNFMTFTHLVFYPGPKLNVVVGPNGSGKSSIASGMYIALGGLASSSKVFKQYVKYGSKEAMASVVLYDSGKSKGVTAKVVFDQQRKKYFLDDFLVTAEFYRSAIAKFNINVSNPCMFLAQEKVQSFTHQSPHDLLLNTLQARESKLKELLAKCEEIEKSVDADRTELDPLAREASEIERQLTRMAPMVQNTKQQIALKSTIELIDQKVLYLNVELNASFETIDTILAKERLGSLLTAAKQKYERTLNEHDAWLEKVNATQSDCIQLAEKLKNAIHELKIVEEERIAKKKECNQYLAKEEELFRQKTELENSITLLHRRKRELEEVANLRRQQMRARFQIFETNGMHMSCGNAWRWYQDHKEQFRHPVYVPLLSLTVINAEASKYLENLIANRDLFVFIFGCKEDELLLTNSSHGWKINSCTINEREICNYRDEKKIPESLRKYGFQYMASQLFEAPPAVKAYLNNVANLNEVPIGSRVTENNLNEVLEEVKKSYRLFLTDKSRVVVSISRYSGELSTRIAGLNNNARLLVSSVKQTINESVDNEISDLNRKEAELKNSIEQSEQQAANIAKLREECRAFLNECSKKKDAQNTIKSHLNAKNERLCVIKKNKPSLEQAKIELEETRSLIMKKMLGRANQIVELLLRTRELLKTRLFVAAEIMLWNGKIAMLKERLENFERETEQRKLEENQIIDQLKEMQSKLLRYTKYFNSATGISSASRDDLSHAEKKLLTCLIKQFDERDLSDNIPNLQNMRSRLQSELVVLKNFTDENDMVKYERLSQKHTEIKEKLGVLKNSIDKKSAQLLELLNEFLSSTEPYIEKINAHFKSFFQKLNCDGEAKLIKPLDKFKMKDYGIRLSTKFRENQELQQLSAKFQSGGERSVTIMLYILALQACGSAPFRCVDEINQGMDAEYERDVFKLLTSLLADNSSELNTQYFMLTPKLVAGLAFNEIVKFHCVYNSQSVSKNQDWIGNGDEFVSLLRANQSQDI